MRRIRQIIVALLMISPIVANADPIIITTPVTITDQNSYTFGDYIFELVDPKNRSDISNANLTGKVKILKRRA